LKQNKWQDIFFKGSRISVLTCWNVEAGYPKKSIAGNWPASRLDFASGVDTAEWRNRWIYFFKGTKYLAYKSIFQLEC
jgi:hypothetical protein